MSGLHLSPSNILSTLLVCLSFADMLLAHVPASLPAGDRIKGTLFLLRVAAKFGKVLLIKW